MSFPSVGDAEAAADRPSPSPQELARGARASGRLGLDTEFMGEGRYQTLLCLVQVAVRDARGLQVGLLDALDPELEAQPLADVLADPAVEVIVHAGRQDVALLRRIWRTEVTSIFDTQIAAGFAGLRAQASYESVLRSVLGVGLGKTASYTRWDGRPLTEEQLTYARADVVHLIDLAEELQRRLLAGGRLQWAREECRLLESATDQRDPAELFERLPRIGSLDPRIRAVARELVQWRETVARSADRPANSVLNDSALVEVARRRPSSRAQLEDLRGLPKATLHRRAADLLAAVQRGCARTPIPAERQRRDRPADEDAPLVALSEALVRTRALDEQLAYELLTTRGELQAIVASIREGAQPPAVRALEGWRHELVGRELVELLTGGRSLSVRPDRRVVVLDQIPVRAG